MPRKRETWVDWLAWFFALCAAPFAFVFDGLLGLLHQWQKYLAPVWVSLLCLVSPLVFEKLQWVQVQLVPSQQRLASISQWPER